MIPWAFIYLELISIYLHDVQWSPFEPVRLREPVIYLIHVTFARLCKLTAIASSSLKEYEKIIGATYLRKYTCTFKN